MLFHVEIVVKIPHDVDSEKSKALSAAEVERAKTLQREGKWLHIWRIVGKWANISVFNVKDGAELHEILTSLLLYPYMEVKVTALCASSIHQRLAIVELRCRCNSSVFEFCREQQLGPVRGESVIA